MTDIKDENTTTDSISLLARDLDEARVRAFIRREMWQFLLDIGWTTDPEPPLRRPGTVASDGKPDVEARFKAESAQLQAKPRQAKPQPAQTAPNADDGSDGKARAEHLAELRARFSPRTVSQATAKQGGDQ
jgi:hypothetical protein